ncbi:MAG TPA: GIY-YIG nuclease family protein [Candidatus Acidoferrales bacterium]|nr:GIY-YIG nuclease family protein [Candidatus Acidoferrales bacterium]
MYFAYIIQSEKTLRYYTGSTKELENRLMRHNNGDTPSTRREVPWKLVHFEEFQSRSEAVKKEMGIKSRGAARYLEDVETKTST